ncbi:GtrA family protein [Wenzhouxiangella limi]|uniref:GtrA family protein n=1 Tax=Wenzhouxiangella limi TaxID=2707351 RepID=A0A845UWR9_9GAMM|nr:GtrA family protein [Wenzhouxiangella limi]NDY95078.1 GtrA family protein [Wenzhouxiangella limi]
MLNHRSENLLERGIRSDSDRAAFFRFALVGVTISIIDAGLVYVLKDLPGMNVYLARIFSYSAAMATGYVLNRYFTFHHVDFGRKLFDQLIRFFSVHSVGGLINFGVFSAVVYLGDRAGLNSFWHSLMPLLGVWLGGVVGMSFNFLVSRKLVFDA